MNKPKNKYNDRKEYDRKEYDFPRNNQMRYQNKFNEPRDEKPQENRYQKSPENKYQNERKDHEFRPNDRFQQDKPPRFQRQRNDNQPKFVQNNYDSKGENSRYNQGNQSNPRNKPDTNNFINKLANEINNMSLYNSKYENEKLNQKPKEDSNNITNWKWKTGDRCMAKYWEDNKVRKFKILLPIFIKICITISYEINRLNLISIII